MKLTTQNRRRGLAALTLTLALAGQAAVAGQYGEISLGLREMKAAAGAKAAGKPAESKAAGTAGAKAAGTAGAKADRADADAGREARDARGAMTVAGMFWER